MGHLPQIPSPTSSLRTEFLGTFLFVLIGTSAITALNIAGQATTSSSILVGTVAFSAAVGWLTYTFYRFPLPQFNPAVTVLFWIQGIQPFTRSLVVIAMQLIGAVAASVVVALLYGSAGVEVRLGAPYPATLMGSWAAVIAEFLGSIIALYAIQTAINRQRLAFFNPFVLIGLGYGLGYLVSVGISGGSLNPARAIAPQLAAADLTGWWAYIAGPIAAAVGIGWLARHTTTQAETVSIETTVTTEAIPPQPQATPPTESELSSDQIALQQKAQQALNSLKDSPERPQLPFAPTKPSFYPLADSPNQAKPSVKTETPLHEPTATEPEQASPSPTPQPKAAASNPEVKFINFENQPPEDEDR